MTSVSCRRRGGWARAIRGAGAVPASAGALGGLPVGVGCEKTASAPRPAMSSTFAPAPSRPPGDPV